MEPSLETPPAPARKRGRPKKAVAAPKLANPLFAGMAESHPIAFAVAVLRLIGHVSTEDEVKALAGAAASELEAAAK